MKLLYSLTALFFIASFTMPRNYSTHFQMSMQVPPRVNTIDSFINSAKIVVIDYWFIGCASCKKSIPDMNQIALAYAPKGVKVFGLNTTDDPDVINKFHTSKSIAYPMYAITPDLAQKHFISNYPTTVIYNDGKVVLTIEGYSELFRKQITDQLNISLKKK